MNTTVKIDLSQDLGADQFINIRDPKMLSWKAQKAIASAAKDNSMEANMGVAEAVALALVVNGNVLDENGQPVPFPLNAESIERVPAVVVERIAEKFAELKGATRKN